VSSKISALEAYLAARDVELQSDADLSDEEREKDVQTGRTVAQAAEIMMDDVRTDTRSVPEVSE
jgi:hypothetical protein